MSMDVKYEIFRNNNVRKWLLNGRKFKIMREWGGLFWLYRVILLRILGEIEIFVYK